MPSMPIMDRQNMLVRAVVTGSCQQSDRSWMAGVERVRCTSAIPVRKAPHNAYTTGEGIVAGIAKTKGYETQHAADYTGHYKFV